MKISPSKAKGVMLAPPSKSMAHRYLICAALAKGQSIIENIDLSEDIKATLGCIKQLGASAEIVAGPQCNKIVVQGAGASGGAGAESGGTCPEQNGTCAVAGGTGTSGITDASDQAGTGNSIRTFNCNESGSTLRFFIPLSMLSGAPARFTGSQVLMTRPLSVYETICTQQKIKLEHVNGGVEVEGKLHSGVFEVPGNISSQFITGLLFALPLLEGDSKIVLTESVESKPYIDMTLQVQKEFGIKAQWINDNTLTVPGGQTYAAHNGAVEGDYSNAAFFEALNYLGGSVEVPGLREDSLQGDKVYVQLFKELSKGYAKIDISDCPDLGPILLAMAGALNGGEFTGTKRLAIKESNRGAVMCQELAKFGIETVQEENRIIVKPGKLSAPAEAVQGHNDHRIVMSMATLLTVTGGTLEGEGAVKKSLPDYFERIKKLGIKIENE